MTFNATQQKYLTFKKKMYHTAEGKQTKTSIIHFDTVEEEIDLIKYFWYNINMLVECGILETGYCGKDFFLNYKSDSNKKINFENYPIKAQDLKEIILQRGSYLPILMFFDEDECLTAIECVHTQHSLRTIKQMFEDKNLINEKFLFVIKPNFINLNENIEFILPLELYQKIGFLLELKTEYLNNKYIKLYTDNAVDLWLLFKLYHKESSFYIVKNMQYMYQNNIKPPQIFNKR